MYKPDPLTPADCDLRDFPYMPLDVVRLRDSEAAVLLTPAEFRAAILLWCASWHQVPAASLPNDDRLLAMLAGMGRDKKGWKRVKDGAIRGFFECKDGRLYHPVIAEKALEAVKKRRIQRERTAAATAASAQRAAEKRNENNEGYARDGSVTDSVTDSATDPVTDLATESVSGVPTDTKGREGREGKGYR